MFVPLFLELLYRPIFCGKLVATSFQKPSSIFALTNTTKCLKRLCHEGVSFQTVNERNSKSHLK